MFRDGLIGVDRDECKAVGWLRKAVRWMGKAAHQPDQASTFQNQVAEVLREWDTKLADVAKGWQIIYDPDPREPVVGASLGSWFFRRNMSRGKV
jgi:hypothetical protein